MKVISAKEAANLIKDGSTFTATGFSGAIVPEHVLAAIEERFLETGHPNNLTLFWNNSVADGTAGKGMDHFGHEGLTSNVITSHLNLLPKVQALVDNNKLPAWVFPMGQITQLFRESGCGRAGVITKVGLGTYVDPRNSGGKANDITKEDKVHLIEFNGEEYLHYPPILPDIAVIRGTTADTHGNISCEREPCISDILVVAQAVKHNNGIVIAQVEDVCEFGALSPRSVMVPGVMVDYVVVSPKEGHPMTISHLETEPALYHKYRKPLADIAGIPLTERKVMARRAAMELKRNSVVNLGFGVPESIAVVAAEEGFTNEILLTVEVGVVGGMPTPVPRFGGCFNPEFVTDVTRQVDWYESGGLDIAFLGLAEVDRFGNVNVSKFGKTIGPGGFINITHATPKSCYCGALTAGGLKVKVEDGKVIIVQEGRKKKFVKDVEQITFSAKAALRDNHEVIYITERAVFRLTESGLELIEIAPGIDLNTQVLDLIDYDVKVSNELKLMDARIFRDQPMGLELTD